MRGPFVILPSAKEMCSSALRVVELPRPGLAVSWPALRNATRWGISILSSDHADKVKMLSRSSAERFTDIDWYQTEDGAVLLTGPSTTFQVSLETEVDAGDRALALLRVHGLHRDMDANPLVFYGSQLRQLAAQSEHQQRVHDPLLNPYNSDDDGAFRVS